MSQADRSPGQGWRGNERLMRVIGRSRPVGISPAKSVELGESAGTSAGLCAQAGQSLSKGRKGQTASRTTRVDGRLLGSLDVEVSQRDGIALLKRRVASGSPPRSAQVA
jgi:hypothetical protein